MRPKYMTNFGRLKQLKEELFVKSLTEPLPNREYWAKTLEYRDRTIKLYGYDPCVSRNANKEEIAAVENIMSRMKILIEDNKTEEAFNKVLRLINF